MPNEIFEKQEWNEATIDERERRILSVIQKRWPDKVARQQEGSLFQRGRKIRSRLDFLADPRHLPRY